MFHHPDLDRHVQKYYGKYRGVVVNNDDSKHPDGIILGRLYVKVPTIFAAAPEAVVTNDDQVIKDATPAVWAEPCFTYGGLERGFFFLPPIGALVWIEFEAGDINYPLWTGIWATPPAGLGKIPIEYTGPATKVLRTEAHLMILDDTLNSETFLYKHIPSGTQVTVSKAGRITVSLPSGEATITTQEDGKVIIQAQSDISITGNTTIKITATGEADIVGSTVKINNGTLGAARLTDSVLSNATSDPAWWLFWSTLGSLISALPTVPLDGGASFKAGLAALFATVPTSLTSKISGASGTVKIGN